jgi:hypothetical protein
MILSPQRPQALETCLAHPIGPRAHHLMKCAAAATAQDGEPLVGRLAAEIDFDPARAGFISACRMLSQPTP